MRTENNTLLDHKIIKTRLKILKEGYASCAIEGLYITGDDKKFMENMISEGLNPDEMIQKIKKGMAL